ncbi:MAG TPA: response regulator [Candidatus Binatia bacterium]|jgi:signal transduction histidine kinase|nr:response regulator [Candidatus Binatia bacterium]
MNATQKASSGPRRPLRVLLVEDSQADAILLARALERGGFAPTYERVDTAVAMETALNKQSWDLILCDHAMPQFSAPAALELLKKHEMDVPFIIVSGYIEEETAVAAMKAGAHDYIMKDHLARLVPAVERELREAAVRRAREKSEAELLCAREELELRVEKRTADLRAANLKLENVIEERKRLENELLEIAENERRQIGFDLHDDLGQKLSGGSMMIKALEQRLAAEQHPCLADAQRIHGLMEEIICHTHNLAHQFSSLDMKGDDLPGVLKGLAANVKRMFEISCGFSMKGISPELQPHTIVQLYKIAQEAVSNAIKHGKAASVAIGLNQHDDCLIMTIKNDGLPFAQPAAKNRMGLRIMNYRANTIGATLGIKPLNKNGTLVTCALPIRLPAKALAPHSPPNTESGTVPPEPAFSAKNRRARSAAPAQSCSSDNHEAQASHAL